MMESIVGHYLTISFFGSFSVFSSTAVARRSWNAQEVGIYSNYLLYCICTILYLSSHSLGV